MTEEVTREAGWVLVPREPTKEMIFAGNKEQATQEGTSDYRSASEIFAAMLASAPAPSPIESAPTNADMRAFGASYVACYRWPDDTPEHRAARAAYCEGAYDATSAVSPESGWLLIENAPQDGTVLDRTAADGKLISIPLWWGWSANAQKHAWCGEIMGIQLPHNPQPTHYFPARPLPPPPAQGGGK